MRDVLKGYDVADDVDDFDPGKTQTTPMDRLQNVNPAEALSS